MKKISRGGAISLLNANGYRYEQDTRLRNYELESRLNNLHGVFADLDWVVWEPCPFNGDFCRYGSETGKR